MESNKKFFVLERLYAQTSKSAEEVESDVGTTKYNSTAKKISGVLHQNKQYLLLYDLNSSFTESIDFKRDLASSGLFPSPRRKWRWYVYEGTLITENAVYDCSKYKSIIDELCTHKEYI